MRAVSRNFIRS